MEKIMTGKNKEHTPLILSEHTRIVVNFEIASLIDNKGNVTSFCDVIFDKYVSNNELKKGFIVNRPTN